MAKRYRAEELNSVDVQIARLCRDEGFNLALIAQGLPVLPACDVEAAWLQIPTVSQFRIFTVKVRSFSPVSGVLFRKYEGNHDTQVSTC